MKFLSYLDKDKVALGVIVNEDNKYVNVERISKGKLPNNFDDYLNNFEFNNIELAEFINDINSDSIEEVDYERIVAPLQNTKSFRDFYAFRKHVEAGRKNRGLDMIPEYDRIPVFYFSNHQSISGPGVIKVQKEHLNKLDFEFEIGVVLSRQARNVKAKDAYKYVAGLTILNDWSARAIQLEEMKLNLGPAKGKDFSTTIGPFLVTLDELKNKVVGPEYEMRYDLAMCGYLNNNLISKDNLKNISWSFADMIERASYGVDLYPGDLIGSGTCSTGCLLELNLSSKNEIWLKPGDEIKLTVDYLGTLFNKIDFINEE